MYLRGYKWIFMANSELPEGITSVMAAVQEIKLESLWCSDGNSFTLHSYIFI